MASIVKPLTGQPARLRLDNSLTKNLHFYLALTEGSGCRPVDSVSGQNPLVGSSVVSGWELGPPGIAFSVPENTGAQNPIRYQFRRPSAESSVGVTTIGCLIKWQAAGATNNNAAKLFGNWDNSSSNDHGAMYFSTAADVNKHLHIEFINTFVYLKANTGQFSAGEIRTVFAHTVPDGNPVAYTALWPTGTLTEPTYSARGAGAGSAFERGIEVFGAISGGFTSGPVCCWWLGVWNRLLSLREMDSLHRDPWQMIEPVDVSDFSGNAAFVRSRVLSESKGAVV
jgi:hypothetical protein